MRSSIWRRSPRRSIDMAERELELTERERLIAEHAANVAVARVMDEFYRNVGRSVVNKLLVLVGAAVVAFALGKGWISIPK